MPRYARMVMKGEVAVYHVMRRTALEDYPFADVDKDKNILHNQKILALKKKQSHHRHPGKVRDTIQELLV